ncbi:MAG TPA: IS200/IS605 family transposase [Phycisphaerae bacterium]|nr:IS200/IS605 family transposase [Phycisphaerales bacterium]HRX84543.1 IS200/IS605 family transposase [Phycisphaerae bacterium]
MPGTHTQLLFHCVFSTKSRQALITPEIAERLYPYMGGIVRTLKGVLYAIGGMPDHVHLYLRWRPNSALANLMRTVKARSSAWVHGSFPDLRRFAWQDGYGAFTVSKSREEALKAYIANQAAHHGREDFKSEYLRLLRAHGVEFDERYVFD